MLNRFAAALLFAVIPAPAFAQPFTPLPPGPIPSVTFAVTPLLDGLCGRLTQEPADTAAARELRARVGEFRAVWSAHGPGLLRAAVEATGQPFRFSETIGALHACTGLNNLSLPLSFSMRRYLRTPPAGALADSLQRFASVVFHEVLHRHVVDVLGEAPATPMWTRFAAEQPVVRWHLHLMAIEDSAFRRLGRQGELAGIHADYRRYPSYARARRIVDSVGAEPFLAELRALPAPPDTVTFASGGLRLRGLLYRPAGAGPHPAVLYNHGSGGAAPSYLQPVEAMAPAFTRAGYVLFVPFRRGQSLSAGQGTAINDRLNREPRERRNALMAELLATEQMDDVLAALDWLKRRSEVDSTRIAVAGISFGGTLAVFSAERAPGIRAAVAAAPAALTWADAPEIQERLRASARRARVPVFFLQAANDRDLTPTEVLAGEMQAAGLPHRRRIYPPFGSGVQEGHSFGFWGAEQWGPDVLAFLAEHLAPSPAAHR